MENETIVNISTPKGYGAIGVIRISGPKSLPILKKLIKRDIEIKPRVVYHFSLFDKDENNLGDSIILFFKEPNSYTGEDLVEIQTFSSPILIEKIISMILEYGARLSEPGEFTLRAFLNGKMDLLTAQSINKIVFSADKYELQSSLNTLTGKFQKRIKNIINELDDLRIRIEGSISFPFDVEEISNKEIISIVSKNLKEIEDIIKNFEKNKPFIDGIKLAIYGKANVGKSSLFNILMEEERVLVSEIPGTTRDFVKEKIYIEDLPIDIIDTAGVIRNVKNGLDKVAQERSEKILSLSTLILLVFDGSIPLNEDDFYAIEKVKDKNFIPVINKIDLPLVLCPEELENILNKKVILISCLTKEGIENLKKEIISFYDVKPEYKELFYLTIREKDLFIQSKNFLKEICEKNLTLDEISFNLKDSLKNLKSILGEDCDMDTLKEIFSKFCIGK